MNTTERNHEENLVAPQKKVDNCQDGLGFVRNEKDKKERSSFSLGCAFRCAVAGVIYAVKTQRNMKIHLMAAIVALVLGISLNINTLSWLAIFLCIFIVFAAECMNTAVESVVDMVSPTYHPLAQHAKDCAAGAVFLCSLGAVIVALFVYIPALWALYFI